MLNNVMALLRQGFFMRDKGRGVKGNSTFPFFVMAFFVVCFCVLVYIPNSYAQGRHKVNEVWLSFSSNHYSDAFSISDLYEDTPESVHSGSVIYSFSQWQLGYQLNPHVAVGIARGWDIYAQHSEIAARVYAEQEISLGQHAYTLVGDVQKTQGLFVAFNGDLNNVNVQIVLEAGEAFDLTSVDINGDVQNQSDALSGVVNIDYFYEKDALYHRKLSTKPKGQYGSLSVNIRYVSLWGRHSLQLQDLLNETHWSNAPFTQVQINTNKVASIDENGVVTARPLGSGIETFKSLNQRFPVRIKLANHVAINKHHELIVGLNSMDDYIWPFVGWRLTPLNMDMSYHFKERSISVSQQWNKYFSYNLTSDHLDTNKMQRLKIGFEVRY
jgi:hypothetical protein